MNSSRVVFLVVAVFTSCVAHAQTYKALFDNTKNETAGNADWIIDTDQPIPSPPQSGITQSTPETYWLGAISAWGVDLVKRGFTVHTLTRTYGITYGNAGNPYDLSNYDLFIVCEPQNPFTTSEKNAIRLFVQNGGGLFMVADHNASDRDNDGWDSPEVWNDLRSDTLFGIHFQSGGESNNNFSQISRNLASGSSDSIIVGPNGTVTGLSYYGGTSMRLLSTRNPTATGHIWMNGVPIGSAAQVMAATALYGSGRVAGIGDSSPADDSTGQSGNNLYNGWTEAGVTNNILFLNLCQWLVGATPILPPAQVVQDEPTDAATNLLLPVTFRWHEIQEAARYQLDVSTSNTFSTYVVNDSTLTDTTHVVGTLAFNATYYWRVRANNSAGWGQFSSTWSLTTLTPPSAVEPLVPPDSSTEVAIPTLFRWMRNPNATTYHLQCSPSEGFETMVIDDSTITDTTTTRATLSAGTSYYWRIRGHNEAGWGVYSRTMLFRAWQTPEQVQLIFPPDGVRGIGMPVELRWRSVETVNSYHFDLATTTTFDSLVVSDSLLVDTSIVLSNLDSLQTFYWRLQGKNAAGHGVYSEIWSFTPANVLRIDRTVSKGWNILSLPVDVPDRRKNVLFPLSISNAFEYTGVYTISDTLHRGKGFWLKFDSARTVTITGAPNATDTLEVEPGWNLVGSSSTPVPVNSMSSDPPSIISSSVFGYTGRYARVDTLQPAHGYWVKASEKGKLILQSEAATIKGEQMVGVKPEVDHENDR